jgi:hypothetical protein
MYDLIGDIHGHADELTRLLEALGYRRERGAYRHAERTAIFLGDLIDRGPRIRETLELVRPMVEEGSALAVLGNHELNALAYATEDRRRAGEHLRRRNPKNTKQHAATLAQLPAEQLTTYLRWFRTLPLWLELEGLRVVHACWDEKSLAAIAPALAAAKSVTDDFLHDSHGRDAPLFDPVETVLKGKSIVLPAGRTFRDDHGVVRNHTRVKWYESPRGHTYRTYALTNEIELDVPLAPSLEAEASPYPADAKPVFIGHYALKGAPALLAPNVACLDYGMGKGGVLCAYRWSGEQRLDASRFVAVRSVS